jgi:hypothetical protein
MPITCSKKVGLATTLSGCMLKVEKLVDRRDKKNNFFILLPRVISFLVIIKNHVLPCQEWH